MQFAIEQRPVCMGQTGYENGVCVYEMNEGITNKTREKIESEMSKYNDIEIGTLRKSR